MRFFIFLRAGIESVSMVECVLRGPIVGLNWSSPRIIPDRPMLDRWFSTIKLPISWKQFKQLPQNPAYKYEYFDKTAWLSPRPKFQRARLELRSREESLPLEVDAEETLCIRRFEERDWPRLSRPFARAFARVQPFASLSERRQLDAARDCLKFTREGGDGPMIIPACHVAISKEGGHHVGAILLTLVPEIDPDDFGSMRWNSAAARGLHRATTGPSALDLDLRQSLARLLRRRYPSARSRGAGIAARWAIPS